jgi:hypothetical protein
MEAETIFVLCDLGSDFEEGQHDSRGRGLRQRGVLQRGRAQGMGQGLGRTREDQTRGSGQAGGRGGAITV